ncbi:MAG TPA: hypothetical protein VGE04_14190, partial [Chloroflexia bacterium]
NLGIAGDMLHLAAILASGRKPLLPAPILEDSSSSQPGLAPRIVVLGVVEVPAGQPLTMGMDMARSYRALFDFLPPEVGAGGKHVRVDRLVKVARDVPTAVRQAVEEEHAGIVLAHWKDHPRNPKRHVYGHILDDLLKDPPCDIVLARPDGWRDCGRVLLPVRGGPSAEQALDIALLLAEHGDMHLAVMHNVPSSRANTGPLGEGTPKKSPTGPLTEAQVAADAMETGPYADFNEYLEAVAQVPSVQIERIATVSESATAAVLGEVQDDDIIIMGVGAFSERGGKGQDAGASTLPTTVAAHTKAPILLLRTRETLDLDKYARKAQGRNIRNAWVDMPFEYWFVENTYHGDEFRDPAEFLKLKQATGLTISVGLLTSNDARHLHSMVTGLRRVLVEMHPLADQIAVVDAGSGDETLEIARSLGVEAYSVPEILPGEGSLHGRGESWWKSLTVLRGDIVVWLDPRATRFHPSAALSLAGPLLRNANLQLVKAFALAQHDQHGAARANEQESRGEGFDPLDVSWGGFVVPKRDGTWPFTKRIRVQALKPADLAALTPAQFAALPPRTIVQVLSPSLAGVVDPFGRDYAARREAMLSIPAFTGPNLELGMLLSVASRWGSRSIAQVELRHAQPSPAPQPGLRIAIDVLQVLAHRLEDRPLAAAAADLASRLQNELQGPAGPDTGFEVRALNPVERPPMSTVLMGE